MYSTLREALAEPPVWGQLHSGSTLINSDAQIESRFPGALSQRLRLRQHPDVNLPRRLHAVVAEDRLDRLVIHPETVRQEDRTQRPAR